ncbi:splicing factor 3B subunit 10-domain-containing protein [Podospora fimiseda]|uniref:Splicing factor 3B subunit 10-domain-containing protein n=1 Tax=Podospora fimiseda TaxID=252190 RepID=A0AAN7BU74_9PEZI|nr:splicing factor 3B subunit 10-domain-containing protein [Podospora fimiseda]
MADKLRAQQELERLQSKYIGTGYLDIISWEWKTNIHRDTSSSIIGHPPLLAYAALVQNKSIAQIRAETILYKMFQPVGPPPPREGEELPVLRTERLLETFGTIALKTFYSIE